MKVQVHRSLSRLAPGLIPTAQSALFAERCTGCCCSYSTSRPTSAAFFLLDFFLLDPFGFLPIGTIQPQQVDSTDTSLLKWAVDRKASIWLSQRMRKLQSAKKLLSNTKWSSTVLPNDLKAQAEKHCASTSCNRLIGPANPCQDAKRQLTKRQHSDLDEANTVEMRLATSAKPETM